MVYVVDTGSFVQEDHSSQNDRLATKLTSLFFGGLVFAPLPFLLPFPSFIFCTPHTLCDRFFPPFRPLFSRAGASLAGRASQLLGDRGRPAPCGLGEKRHLFLFHAMTWVGPFSTASCTTQFTTRSAMFVSRVTLGRRQQLVKFSAASDSRRSACSFEEEKERPVLHSHPVLLFSPSRVRRERSAFISANFPFPSNGTHK
mgnify:FL=1